MRPRSRLEVAVLQESPEMHVLRPLAAFVHWDSSLKTLILGCQRATSQSRPQTTRIHAELAKNSQQMLDSPRIPPTIAMIDPSATTQPCRLATRPTARYDGGC